MAFTLTSPAFAEAEEIPPRFTCDGADIAPELQWSEIPTGTHSLVLILHDPDSTKKPDFTHWVLYDINPTGAGLPEGMGDAAALPGANDFGSLGYGGPCPAVGRHRYVFDLYALDVPTLGLSSGASRADVEAAMEGHLLARARLAGFYERHTA